MREIERCRRCPLGAQRAHIVVYRGAVRPRLVFVGEAPGRDEDRLGVPFVGRAGRVLDEAIATLGLSPTSFGILNVVKCRPPNNRLSTRSVHACQPFLDRQLSLLRPRLLVPLGAHALRALDPEAPPVGTAAGTPRTVNRRRLFPLLHPAATFRATRWARRWRRDVARLGRFLDRPLETL